jgi:hypothetical protein
MRVECPEQCFKQQVSKSYWECVCPVADDAESESALKQVANCDSTVEVCGKVKVVEVGAGFKYNKNAFRNWAMLSTTMVSFSSYAGAPYNSDTSMSSAWLYNFFWTYFTWGTQLFLLIQKVLFKSEGGAIHKWFTRAVNFSVINYFLAFWMTDILILRGTLDTNSAASSDWYNLGALFFLQIVSTFVQIGSKGSLDFDYNLAKAEPTDFKQSTYQPDSSELEQPDSVTPENFENFNQSPSTTTRQSSASESDVENYWGF